MGIFGRIFGSKKALDDITDKDNGHIAKLGGWIDRQQYTDEEKAEMQKSLIPLAIDLLKALEPFKVVQRILAFAISFIWACIALNVAVAIWVRAVTCSYKQSLGVDGELVKTFGEGHCINAVEAFTTLAFSDFIFWPVTVCFGLYFGGGLLESLKRSKD